MKTITSLTALKEEIAKADLSTKTKKVRGKESVCFSFNPDSGEWREASFSKEKKTKGKTYKSLMEAFDKTHERQRISGVSVSTLVLLSYEKNDDGAMTHWLVADAPEISADGEICCEHFDMQLSLPELAECDERIAFYDGYYIYPITRAAHATLGRILGLAGQFDTLKESTEVPIGLAMVMADALAKRKEINLVYSARRNILHNVRPLTGITLMDTDKMLSHRDIFTIFEDALTSKCLWTLSEHEVTETYVKALCDVVYPFQATVTFYDGCTPGDGAYVGIDIHDGDAVMRAGSASFGHASKTETAYALICNAVDEAERFAEEYQQKKDCPVEFQYRYANAVFKCIGKTRTRNAEGMSLKAENTVSELIRETVRVYHTDELNAYKEGKLLEAYAEEAKLLMKEADVNA